MESATIHSIALSTFDEVPVRISELARQAELSVPTVKYYLREGLLPGGTPTAPNQADYGEDHVRRLRLIRTLRDVGGLDIDRIRRVIAAIENESLSRHELFGVAERVGTRAGPSEATSEDRRRARDEVDLFIDGLGWRVRPNAAGRQELADALAALRRIGRDYGADMFRPYAEAADRMAAWEVGSIPTSEPRAVAVERMVVGTVVFGAIFDALRRLAHEHHSAGRSATEPPGDGARPPDS
jgi:DNA-binding transcriptional MerR regulator